jgi:hypothetical protein
LFCLPFINLTVGGQSQTHCRPERSATTIVSNQADRREVEGSREYLHRDCCIKAFSRKSIESSFFATKAAG